MNLSCIICIIKNKGEIKMYELKVRNEILGQEIFNKFEKFLDVAPLTLRAYKTGLKRFAEYLAVKQITAPTRDDVLAYKNALLEHGLKASTVASYLSKVKKFFSWCEAEGFYHNIANGVKAPKISKNHKRDCFSSEQLKEILNGFNRNTIEGARNFAMFSLMSCCGLRTIEVSRAKIEDLRSECGVNVLYIQGKNRTEKADFVKIPEAVRKAIQEYIELRGKVETTEALFASISDRNCGEALTTRSISRICKSAMLNSGFNSSRLTAHSLRHSSVTLALMNGETLQNVQAFARHSNIQTTLIYAHNINRLNSGIEINIAKEIF